MHHYSIERHVLNREDNYSLQIFLHSNDRYKYVDRMQLSCRVYSMLMNRVIDLFEEDQRDNREISRELINLDKY